MKFIVNKKDILNILSNIQGITGKKTSLSITSNLLISTKGSNIKFTATDLETSFEGLYPAKIETEGSIAINAQKIFEIVRDYPDDEILFDEIENKWINIGKDNVVYHIVGADYDNFPDIPEIDDISFFNIESLYFKKMIEKSLVIGITDSTDTRPHILGVYLEIINDKDNSEKILRMVSTDGGRLSKADYLYKSDTKLFIDKGIIIPKKELSEIYKFFDNQGNVLIGFKDNHFILKKEKETVISRLLEGIFPKYEDIIKKGKCNIIKIKKQLFMMMLKRMSILSSDNYKGVIFNFYNNKLTITSTNPELGESKEYMYIDFKGEPFEVAFNPKFFIDTLNVIEGENIILNIIDEEHPCLIEDAEDNNYINAIMPMRI